MKKLLFLVAFALAVTPAITPQASAIYSLQFTGLDIYYDGNNIYTQGGDGFDPLTTMVENNNGAVTAFTNPPTSMTANMFIGGVGPLLASGQNKTFLPSQPTGFDLAFGTGFLNLNWDEEVTIEYSGGGDLTILMSGVTSDLVSTNLPITTPITVSFSTQIEDRGIGFRNETQLAGGLGDDDDVQYLLWADASGTGEVRGPNAEIPEPATLLLLGGGLAAGAVARRRRKK